MELHSCPFGVHSADAFICMAPGHNGVTVTGTESRTAIRPVRRSVKVDMFCANARDLRTVGKSAVAMCATSWKAGLPDRCHQCLGKCVTGVSASSEEK
jgi:hypothetical protein